MSDQSSVAVRLRDVSKSYTVHAKPRYWLADFLGLGPLLREGRHYRSFWALRDINLEIPRGGRIALVGRNGAGKSTLLRIISENIAPTTGTVEVNGRCEALMQLGTGFNPEFTGRANVFSALAYMGVTGKKAEEKLQDILDFSELDEFIDQPVRTYSSGMYLRLAFTVATVIAPEILIIDEVLAAGDMYFQSKCLARIGELTSGPGTTVIFVSHDLESAQRLCNTFVWLDRGRVVAQGPSSEVRAAYEDSIRKQQEMRLRARNLRVGPGTITALECSGEDGSHLLGRFVLETADGRAAGPHVEGIRLYVRGTLAEAIRVGDAMDDNAAAYPSFLITNPAESSWGPPERRDGRLSRAVKPDESGVTGAKFALFLHHDDVTDPLYRLELEVLYQDSATVPSHVELNANLVGLKRVLSLEHAADNRWKTARVEVPRWVYAPPGSGAKSVEKPAGDVRGKNSSETARVPPERRFGTGQVLIERARFLNARSEETFVFGTGQVLSIELGYETKDPSLVGTTMLWAVGFERADGIMAATLISTLQERVFTLGKQGRLRMTLDPLLLTRGSYRVSLVLFSELDLDGFSQPFTRSSSIYDMHRLAYEIAIEGTYNMEIGLVRHPVRWDTVADAREA